MSKPNPYQNSFYNPCEVCDFKQRFNRCAFGKRSTCASFVLSNYLHDMEREHITKHDEIFIEILKRHGWRGELRKGSSVEI